MAFVLMNFSTNEGLGKSLPVSLHDTTGRKIDSLHTTNKKDSFSVPLSKSALTSEVKYKAKDSIIFDVQSQKVYLYGKGHMDYGDIKLDAGAIRIDYTTNTIFARGLKDSSGKIQDKPVFAEGKEVTHSDSLAYDFKSKKGKVYNLFTNEGEGYIHVQEAKTEKINGKDVIYAKNAKYTTCNLPEDPHFYIASHKMKLMPNDKVITGPAWIVIEGVPMPVLLPFGFFPAHSNKTSGIILPSYGESATQGFALKGGGFYFGGNEHFDAAIKGDIYTEGGYRLELQSRYKTIYRYSGDVDISYARNQTVLPETPGFSYQENYALRWTHQQDPKASPGTTFNASVDAATPGFSTKNDYTNINAITNQTLSSSINYSKRFGTSPFNLSIAITHSQNLSLKTINFGLPDATFSMDRQYPFKRSTETKKHWYDEISVGYTARLLNHLSTYDSTIKSDIVDLSKYRSGIDQEIPVSASFKVMRYFTLSPSINNSIYLYTKKFVDQFGTYYDPVTQRNRDTTISNIYSGIYVAHTHSANMSLGTTIYGMYKFRRGNVLALRHVMTPTISATYSPDYSSPVYGYYGSYVADAYGTVRKFSYYTDGSSVISAPSLGRQGALSFSLQNNFEMKVKTPNDTVKTTKKVKLLDNLSFNGSYNFLADSMKLSPITMSANTTLFEKLNVQGGALFDPYYRDDQGRPHRYYDWDIEHKIGHINSANLSLTANLNNKADKSKDRQIYAPTNPFVYYNYPQAYADFDVPWNAGISYIANYDALHTVLNADGVYRVSPQITHSVSIRGDLSLTKNWKITVQSGYDFTNKKPTISNIEIFRDLHCWAMSFQWIPFGTYRSYFFNIHIKASSLQDLKLEKKREYYDF